MLMMTGHSPLWMRVPLQFALRVSTRMLQHVSHKRVARAVAEAPSPLANVDALVGDWPILVSWYPGVTVERRLNNQRFALNSWHSTLTVQGGTALSASTPSLQPMLHWNGNAMHANDAYQIDISASSIASVAAATSALIVGLCSSQKL